jgi:uncharacterized membrane protein
VITLLALIFGKLVGALVAVIAAVIVLLAAFTNTLDTAVFVNIILGVLALVSPVILKKIPAHDGRMVVVCIAFSLVLSIAGVAFSGGLALDWHSAQQVGLALAAFMGLQQTFYAALRDALRLDQP